MPKATILVIEDDPDIRELVAFSLGKEGYGVNQAESGELGIESAAASTPDLVILDVMLPGMDGLETLRALKANPALARVPVILASAKGEDPDVVAGLELGADDYVVKPYSPRVLVARVRTALRRRFQGSIGDLDDDAVLSVSGISLDPDRHEIRAEGERVDLSATEFAILELLMRSPGRVYGRSSIIDSVKGRDYPVTDRSVDVQIVSLRRKLGGRGDSIETVRGVGYRFKEI